VVSNAISITTYNTPAVPTIGKATGIAGGATVTWTADTSTTATPVTGYYVYYSTSSTGPWTPGANVTPATAASINVTSLTGSTLYYFEVASYSAPTATGVTYSGYTSLSPAIRRAPPGQLNQR